MQGVPNRFNHAIGHARRKAEDDLDRGLVRDDVPAAAQVVLERRALRRLEAAGGHADVVDPLDLERPHRVAVLVPADQVQGMGLQRGLDDERPHRAPAALPGAALVGRALVLDLDHAALRPRPRQLPDVVDEVRIERGVLQDVEAARHVLPERLGQVRRELLERRAEVGVVLVGVADHQPRSEEDGHRLGQGELERRQEGRVEQPPAALVRPHRQPDLPLQRPEIAVHVAHGHPEPLGDVLRAHAVGVGDEEAGHTHQARRPVALRGPSLGRVEVVHRDRGYRRARRKYRRAWY